MFGKAQAEFGLGRPQLVLEPLDELRRLRLDHHSQEEHLRYYKPARHARHQQAEWFAAAKHYLKARPRPV